MSNAEKAYRGSQLLQQVKSQSGEAKVKATELLLDVLKGGIGAAYDVSANNRMSTDLRQVGSEIDAGIADAGGVMISRLTIRHPDGAGNFHYEYAGLQVAGFGKNAEEIDKGERECHDYRGVMICIPKDGIPVDTSGICTPENPTGGPTQKGAEMKALPKGYNMGYGALVASKLSKVIERNPKNDSGGIVLQNSYIERQHVFISQDQWAEIKSSWAEDKTPPKPTKTDIPVTPGPALP